MGPRSGRRGGSGIARGRRSTCRGGSWSRWQSQDRTRSSEEFSTAHLSVANVAWLVVGFAEKNNLSFFFELFVEYAFFDLCISPLQMIPSALSVKSITVDARSSVPPVVNAKTNRDESSEEEDADTGRFVCGGFNLGGGGNVLGGAGESESNIEKFRRSHKCGLFSLRTSRSFNVSNITPE